MMFLSLTVMVEAGREWAQDLTETLTTMLPALNVFHIGVLLVCGAILLDICRGTKKRRKVEKEEDSPHSQPSNCVKSFFSFH